MLYSGEKVKYNQEMKSNQDGECRANKMSTDSDGGVQNTIVGQDSRRRSANCNG